MESTGFDLKPGTLCGMYRVCLICTGFQNRGIRHRDPIPNRGSADTRYIQMWQVPGFFSKAAHGFGWDVPGLGMYRRLSIGKFDQKLTKTAQKWSKWATCSAYCEPTYHSTWGVGPWHCPAETRTYVPVFEGTAHFSMQYELLTGEYIRAGTHLLLSGSNTVEITLQALEDEGYVHFWYIFWKTVTLTQVHRDTETGTKLGWTQ
ncbi:hypothetical protein DFH06DRAFT_1130954 [Mycena polygramma]|nr:hypothetical protein DFH06DRAFT_1130954 [Mycena polygramma]